MRMAVERQMPAGEIDPEVDELDEGPCDLAIAALLQVLSADARFDPRPRVGSPLPLNRSGHG